LEILQQLQIFAVKPSAFAVGTDIRQFCALVLSLRKDFRKFISLENRLIKLGKTFGTGDTKQ
jgi:hypothetical protein